MIIAEFQNEWGYATLEQVGSQKFQLETDNFNAVYPNLTDAENHYKAFVKELID